MPRPKSSTWNQLVAWWRCDRNRHLSKEIGVKRIVPCDSGVASRHSGYRVGDTWPFGMKRARPVYIEASILVCAWIYLHGGQRGYLVNLMPAVLVAFLNAVPVHYANAYGLQERARTTLAPLSFGLSIVLSEMRV